MRRQFARPHIALLLAAPLLAGCLDRGAPTVANTLSEDDDTFCRANNVAAGSPEYIACRKDRDVARNNATARADRRNRRRAAARRHLACCERVRRNGLEDAELRPDHDRPRAQKADVRLHQRHGRNPERQREALDRIFGGDGEFHRESVSGVRHGLKAVPCIREGCPTYFRRGRPSALRTLVGDGLQAVPRSPWRLTEA